MPVTYVCDNCGHRGIDVDAQTADQVLCEVCGEPVLDDLNARPDPRSRGTDPPTRDG